MGGGFSTVKVALYRVARTFLCNRLAATIQYFYSVC